MSRVRKWAWSTLPTFFCTQSHWVSDSRLKVKTLFSYVDDIDYETHNSTFASNWRAFMWQLAIPVLATVPRLRERFVLYTSTTSLQPPEKPPSNRLKKPKYRWKRRDRESKIDRTSVWPNLPAYLYYCIHLYYNASDRELDQSSHKRFFFIQQEFLSF